MLQSYNLCLTLLGGELRINRNLRNADEQGRFYGYCSFA